MNNKILEQSLLEQCFLYVWFRELPLSYKLTFNLLQ